MSRLAEERKGPSAGPPIEPEGEAMRAAAGEAEGMGATAGEAEGVDPTAAEPPGAPPRSRETAGRRFTVGDLVGGLTGMAVALPQSMGLGIALFASMGLDASGGALAGLVGAAAISLVSGLGGNTRGMISAPNGPVVIFLIGALASAAAAGVGSGDLPAVLAALVVLAGLFQVILGVSGGGQLIKYIPYSVVSGLVTAMGVLMVASQLPALVGGHDMSALWGALGERSLPEASRLFIPAATAAVTLIGIRLVHRRLPRVPGIVGGFVLGLAAFHLAAALMGGPIPAAWVVGTIPGLDSLASGMGSTDPTALPWQLIVVSALVLSVVASIDCMVTAVVADAATGERHNSGRELVAQGLGQILAGLLGGSGGGGTKGSTLTAIHSGGRRWPAVIAALGIVVLVLFLRPLGEFLPVGVLAGIVIHVGVQMVDWRIASWVRRRKARVDGILALVVVVATLAFDVMTGVGVGAIGAAVLFIRGQSSATAIGQRATGKERRSLRHRSDEEKKLLDAHGDRILYVELRGHLFFGTVDRLFTELFDDLRRPAWIVINMRRVQSLDLSGLNLLRQMTSLSAANGGHVLFANVYPGVAPERKIKKGLRLLGPADRSLKAKTFKNADKALQYAEDRLLVELTGRPPSTPSQSVKVEDNDLCRSMRPKVRAALAGILRPVELRAKDRVFTAGDSDDALYLVLEGEVDVRLASDKYHYKRLKRVGPGGFFGEIGFLHSGPRVTTAVALGDVKLMALDRRTVESSDDPAVAEAIQALQAELARELAARLRWTTSEICRIEKR